MYTYTRPLHQGSSLVQKHVCLQPPYAFIPHIQRIHCRLSRHVCNEPLILLGEHTTHEADADRVELHEQALHCTIRRAWQLTSMAAYLCFSCLDMQCHFGKTLEEQCAVAVSGQLGQLAGSLPHFAYQGGKPRHRQTWAEAQPKAGARHMSEKDVRQNPGRCW